MKLRISQLVDSLQPDDITLEEKPFDRAAAVKGEVYRRIRRQAAEQPMKKRRTLGRLPLAAAIALICLATTAAAASAGLLLQDFLHAMFGSWGEEASQGVVEYDENGRLVTNIPGWERVPVDETLADELIAPYAVPQNGSLTWEGYTLTTELNLYDASTGCGILCCTLENPEGLTGYRTYPDGGVSFTGETVSVMTNMGEALYLDKARSTDQKLALIDYYIADKDEPSPLRLVEFITTGYYVDVGEIPLTIATEKMTALSLSDGAILVSPIGIRADLAGLTGVKKEEGLDSIVLQYRNGTSYVVKDEEAFLDNSSYALGRGSEEIYVFNRLVDISQLASIVVEGTEYLLAED